MEQPITPEEQEPSPGAGVKLGMRKVERTDRAVSSAERSGEPVRANPVVQDETYGSLRQDERIVMRQQIALNIDSFRAASEGFAARSGANYAPPPAVHSPFMSVIIPNFNGERFLPELFAALARQTFADFEVIFVDDAGTDGSVAWVEAHALQARVIVNRRNLGFVASVNLGAAAARGKVIVLLNNDTEPEAAWLAQLALAICRNPQAAIFTGKVLLHSRPDTLHTTGDMLRANGLPANRGVWEQDTGQHDATTEIFGGCGCGVAIRREVWEALGGLDEDFWMYLDDVDFAFRAQLMGVTAVYVPQARLLHHVTGTAGGALASYYVGRNTIWAIAKNMPRSLLLRNGAQIVAAQLRIAVDAARHVRGREARARLRGQAAGVLTLGRMLQKRRVVQARRVLEDAELARRFIAK